VKILKYPNPFLTTPTEEIDFSKDFKGGLADPLLGKISEMKLLLEKMPRAVAIAANQVGINGRFFVLNKDFAETHKLPQVIVNPKYSVKSIQSVVDNEGCLSFPGANIPVKRHKEIVCTCNSIEGADLILELTDWPARVFQHEIEHLDGKVFIDNLDRIRKYQVIGEMRKKN